MFYAAVIFLMILVEFCRFFTIRIPVSRPDGQCQIKAVYTRFKQETVKKEKNFDEPCSFHHMQIRSDSLVVTLTEICEIVVGFLVSFLVPWGVTFLRFARVSHALWIEFPCYVAHIFAVGFPMLLPICYTVGFLLNFLIRFPKHASRTFTLCPFYFPCVSLFVFPCVPPYETPCVLLGFLVQSHRYVPCAFSVGRYTLRSQFSLNFLRTKKGKRGKRICE